MKKDVSRRDFLKTTGMGAAVIPTAGVVATQQAQAQAATDRTAVIAALGDTIIPSDPGDPGYRTLEPYNITAEVMKGLTGLSDDDLALFNNGASSFFSGKTFLELGESERADFLNLIIDGSRIADQQLWVALSKRGKPFVPHPHRISQPFLGRRLICMADHRAAPCSLVSLLNIVAMFQGLVVIAGPQSLTKVEV